MVAPDKALAGGLRRILLACALALLAFHAGGVLLDDAAAIRDPTQLDYGEGVVWQQAFFIPGPDMYRTHTGFPLILFNYPPIFFLLTHAAARLEPDLLAAGRMVAAASGLAVAALVTALVLALARGRKSAGVFATAALAGLLMLSVDPLRTWGLFMRVDLPGIALGLLGLLVMVRADGRFWGTTLALLLCTMAVFTKQSLLAAGLAVFLFGLFRRPWPTTAAAAVAGSAGMAVVLWMQHVTGGGFMHELVSNNMNRIDPSMPYKIMADERQSIPAILLMLAGAAWVLGTLAPSLRRFRVGAAARELWALRHAQPAAASRALLLLHFALAGLCLPSMLKSGSNINYLLDWMASGSVLLGVMLVDLHGMAIGRPAANLGLLLVLVALSPQPLRQLPDRPVAGLLAKQAALVREVAAATKPVASEDISLLMRAGKTMVFEPAGVTDWALLGRWDEQPLVDIIRHHGFAMMITTDDIVGASDRRTAAVDAAMRAAYPVVERVTPLVWVRRPAQRNSP